MASVKIFVGDSRITLKRLPAKSVHTCITSPPYFMVRDYGTAAWEGGDPECDHLGISQSKGKSTLKNDGRPQDKVGQNEYERGVHRPYGKTCKKCGAKRVDNQIGVEARIEDYILNLVVIFREVRRVLRDDGTLWLNIADTYSMHKGVSGKANLGKIKKKELLGVPGRLVEALRSPWRRCLTCRNEAHDMQWGKVYTGGQTHFFCPTCMKSVEQEISEIGWYWRSEIIWHKNNAKPENVTDRPTREHEQLYLLTKKPRYFYDHEAIKEITKPSSVARVRQADFDNQTGGKKDYRNTSVNVDGSSMRNTLVNWKNNDNLYSRNKRTVWTIPTRAYKGAHFATFPPDLVEPCILAGTSEWGVCEACGTPWERVVERRAMVVRPGPSREARSDGGKLRTQINGTMLEPPKSKTVGWKAGCNCCPLCDAQEEHEACTTYNVTQGTVLDCFAGAVTTGLVASRLLQNSIMCELNPNYAIQGRGRLYKELGMLFTHVEIL